MNNSPFPNDMPESVRKLAEQIQALWSGHEEDIDIEIGADGFPTFMPEEGKRVLNEAASDVLGFVPSPAYWRVQWESAIARKRRTLEEEELPDWLAELEAAEETDLRFRDGADGSEEGDLASWLDTLDDESDEVPDWLKDPRELFDGNVAKSSGFRTARMPLEIRQALAEFLSHGGHEIRIDPNEDEPDDNLLEHYLREEGRKEMDRMGIQLSEVRVISGMVSRGPAGPMLLISVVPSNPLSFLGKHPDFGNTNTDDNSRNASEMDPALRIEIDRLLESGADRIEFSIIPQPGEPALATLMRPDALKALVQQRVPADSAMDSITVVFERIGNDLGMSYIISRKGNGIDSLFREIAEATGVGVDEVKASLKNSLDAMLDAGIETHDCGHADCGITRLLQERKRERELEKRNNQTSNRRSEKFEVLDVRWIKTPEPLRPGYVRFHYRNGFPEWLIKELAENGFNHPDWFSTLDVLYKGTPPEESESEGLTEEQVSAAMLKAVDKFLGTRDMQLALLPLQAMGGVIAFFLGLAALLGRAFTWLWNEVATPLLRGAYYGIGAFCVVLTFVNLPLAYYTWTLYPDNWLFISFMGMFFGWGTAGMANFVMGFIYADNFSVNYGRVVHYKLGEFKDMLRSFVAYGVRTRRWLNGAWESTRWALWLWWKRNIRNRWYHFTELLARAHDPISRVYVNSRRSWFEGSADWYFARIGRFLHRSITIRLAMKTEAHEDFWNTVTWPLNFGIGFLRYRTYERQEFYSSDKIRDAVKLGVVAGDKVASHMPWYYITGLSLSYCVRDIAEGKVPLKRVVKIIANTNTTDWDHTLEFYREDTWSRSNPDECVRIARLLIEQGKVEQPRQAHDDGGHDIKNGYWLVMGRKTFNPR